MKTIREFLELYSKKNTKRVYRAGIHDFLEFIYGCSRNGRKATEAEIASFETFASQYLTERKDHSDDLMRFAASLNEKPPKTARAYLAGIKEFLAYNGVELTQRQLKSIRLKLPKGSMGRTVEKDMDATTIRIILQHMDTKGRALVMVLASSGMRVGEALSITLEDINLQNNPAMITVRGRSTKTGDNRITFISREAKESLVEWLKVRDQYMQTAQNRNKGLVNVGIGRAKNPDDKRIFPFSNSVVNQMLMNALEKAGLLSIDNSTNRKQLHIHQLRKFFRSQLALGCPVDIVESLMGHEGYLTEAYRQYSKAQMAEFYLKGEHLLYIQMPKEIAQIESEFKSEVNQNRKLIQGLVLENQELKQGQLVMQQVNEELRSQIQTLEKKIDWINEMINEDLQEQGEIAWLDLPKDEFIEKHRDEFNKFLKEYSKSEKKPLDKVFKQVSREPNHQSFLLCNMPNRKPRKN